MQHYDYKESLVEAVQVLESSENEVFTAMVNVGFKGVYEELSRLHERGDVINLEIAMFEETGDQNVDVLVEAVKAIAKAKQSLLNLNALNLPDLQND